MDGGDSEFLEPGCASLRERDRVLPQGQKGRTWANGPQISLSRDAENKGASPLGHSGLPFTGKLGIQGTECQPVQGTRLFRESSPSSNVHCCAPAAVEEPSLMCGHGPVQHPPWLVHQVQVTLCRGPARQTSLVSFPWRGLRIHGSHGEFNTRGHSSPWPLRKGGATVL